MLETQADVFKQNLVNIYLLGKKANLCIFYLNKKLKTIVSMLTKLYVEM